MLKFKDINGNKVMTMDDKGELQFEDKAQEAEFKRIEEAVNKNINTNEEK